MAAVSISITIALLKPQIMDSFTFLEISETELKSPGLETGKPASITSTPRLSKSFAISTFSLVFNWHPGTCSPSLKVVSKT